MREANNQDVARAEEFNRDKLHRARASERVAAVDDTERSNVEEALNTYLPRAVYVLFTLINKLDGMSLPADRRRLIDALLLNVFDQANSLRAHPIGRARPRQLTVPPRFRENNIWLALEDGIQELAKLNFTPLEPAHTHPKRHDGSRDLRTVIESMLEYSNNFIANDLFLLLGDAGDGLPLDTAKAQRAADAWARETFGWRDHRIEDGAGLSPGNRLSARQLLDAVKAFAPYRELLPSQNGRVRAKTGTLSGVSCLTGTAGGLGGRDLFFSFLAARVPRLPVARRLQVAMSECLIDYLRRAEGAGPFEPAELP